MFQEFASNHAHDGAFATLEVLATIGPVYFSRA
jgi:hypothetical protein